jgi:hypothetical protein
MLTQNNRDPQTQQELLQWHDVITKQNYFNNNNDTIIQHDGLAVGAPFSGLNAEMFLQHIEHRHLAHLAHTHTHKIINHWRYVDDILIAFDPDHTNIQKIIQHFNTLNYSSQQKQKKTTP